MKQKTKKLRTVAGPSSQMKRLRFRIRALEIENESLKATINNFKCQIGKPPEGSHPDEQAPRAKTWHEERLNWKEETETLRRYIKSLVTSPTFGQRLSNLFFPKPNYGIKVEPTVVVKSCPAETKKYEMHIGDSKVELPPLVLINEAFLVKDKK